MVLVAVKAGVLTYSVTVWAPASLGEGVADAAAADDSVALELAKGVSKLEVAAAVALALEAGEADVDVISDSAIREIHDQQMYHNETPQGRPISSRESLSLLSCRSSSPLATASSPVRRYATALWKSCMVSLGQKLEWEADCIPQSNSVKLYHILMYQNARVIESMVVNIKKILTVGRENVVSTRTTTLRHEK